MTLAICHNCLRKAGLLSKCNGPCACKIDGKDIRDHQRTGQCPLGLFNLSAEELSKLYPPTVTEYGPGTELEAMFKLIIDDQHCSSCALSAAQMNAWGVKGCRQNREEIISWITAAAKDRGWLAIISAGVNAARHGLPLTIGGLVDEAIRRVEGCCDPPKGN